MFLVLQPMANPAAAGWLLGALEGQAKQEVLSMGAEEVNTPGKIFAILEQHWGEHCDSSTLAGAFFRHQKGLAESMGEYASNFRLLWAKTNAVQAGTLSEVMLRDNFVGGLHPVSLKWDIKRYIRENADSAFADVTRKALCWMGEDSCPDTNAEQLQAVISQNSLHWLEAQIPVPYGSKLHTPPTNCHLLAAQQEP